MIGFWQGWGYSKTLGSAGEIEELFFAYQEADAAFHRVLRNERRDANIFIVEDPDRNLIPFAGPANSRPLLNYLARLGWRSC